MSLNLHSIVRAVINHVNEDEVCKLYQANGQVNISGKLYAVYNEPLTVKVNIQPLDSDKLENRERIKDTKDTVQAFLLSDNTFPVMGTSRIPIKRGGDIVERADGSYWLITAMIEDWNNVGWANVELTKQITSPDFTHSDWYNSDT